VGGNDNIDLTFPDYFPEDVIVIGSVERVMEQRTFDREHGCFFNPEAGGAVLPPAYMEMGDMHLMAACQFFKDIMVPRRDRVMDVILG
jgi:hypothetical protein